MLSADKYTVTMGRNDAKATLREQTEHFNDELLKAVKRIWEDSLEITLDMSLEGDNLEPLTSKDVMSQAIQLLESVVGDLKADFKL